MHHQKREVLIRAQKRELLISLDMCVHDAEVSTCITCVSGNLDAFKAKAPRKLTTNKLLVTMDFVGPIQVNAFDGFNGLVNILMELWSRFKTRKLVLILEF